MVHDQGGPHSDPVVEFAETMAGVPDAFQRLWTPHRMAYIKGDSKPKDSSTKQCPFCVKPQHDDPDGLIVHRGKHCFVVMNLFPYSPGHLLVCPYRHISWYTDANDAEVAEMADLTRTAMRVLGEVSHPAGFNIGMNQGEVAGAGIAAHLHQHVVPRWLGDSNFLPVVGQTRAVPQLLADARSALAEAWLAATEG
ncbi:HIT family protein [Luteococcus sp. Sow4_B9]|uniref:HIT family protein n=1 Tax=Luteococcus sp. Sow4_B9 TaxID=3438792 RepID=UPI003F9A00AA